MPHIGDSHLGARLEVTCWRMMYGSTVASDTVVPALTVWLSLNDTSISKNLWPWCIGVDNVLLSWRTKWRACPVQQIIGKVVANYLTKRISWMCSTLHFLLGSHWLNRTSLHDYILNTALWQCSLLICSVFVVLLGIRFQSLCTRRPGCLYLSTDIYIYIHLTRSCFHLHSRLKFFCKDRLLQVSSCRCSIIAHCRFEASVTKASHRDTHLKTIKNIGPLLHRPICTIPIYTHVQIY